MHQLGINYEYEMKPESEKQAPATTSASFTLVGFGMQPDEVTKAFGIEPTTIDVSHVTRCGTTWKEECGLWSCDTAQRLSAEEDDIGAHLEYLLSLFRPLKSRIEEIRPRPNAIVHLRCKPVSMLRPFAAPQIDSRHIAGIADLGAALKFQLLA